MADGSRAILHGQAAGRVALVGGARRVRRHQRDALGCQPELIGGNLQQRRFHALAEFGLAGEDRHRAVCIDADPGIEHRLVVQGPRQLRPGGLLGTLHFALLRLGAAQQRKAHQQGAGAGQHPASRGRMLCHDFVSHSALPGFRPHQIGRPSHSFQDAHVRAAATQVGLHMCSDLRVARVGRFCSRAWARIIMPAMQ